MGVWLCDGGDELPARRQLYTKVIDNAIMVSLPHPWLFSSKGSAATPVMPLIHYCLTRSVSCNAALIVRIPGLLVSAQTADEDLNAVLLLMSIQVANLTIFSCNLELRSVLTSIVPFTLSNILLNYVSSSMPVNSMSHFIKLIFAKFT